MIQNDYGAVESTPTGLEPEELDDGWMELIRLDLVHICVFRGISGFNPHPHSQTNPFLLLKPKEA